RDSRLLDEGLTEPKQKSKMGWVADYALCSWGPGGKGTAAEPYWRWPGSFLSLSHDRRAMQLADVARPAEALQISDGFTIRYNPYMTNCLIRLRHQNGLLNGAFLDGHARVITARECDRVSQDPQGYFYTIAAAYR